MTATRSVAVSPIPFSLFVKLLSLHEFPLGIAHSYLFQAWVYNGSLVDTAPRFDFGDEKRALPRFE